jgi:hypothetical protein
LNIRPLAHALDLVACRNTETRWVFLGPNALSLLRDLSLALSRALAFGIWDSVMSRQTRKQAREVIPWEFLDQISQGFAQLEPKT